MPIHRYEGAGVWGRLKNVYRYEGAGVWGRLKNLYRYEGAGVWGKIFSAIGVIVATTNPTFRNGVNINPDPNTTGSLFIAGQDLTLTRGAYTEDGIALPNTTSVKYELKIFRKAVSSISESYSTDLTTWDEITASTVNFLGNAGSTASSSTLYTVTNVDANINGAGQGYRFAGRVRVTSNANDTVPDWEKFPIIHQYGVARINFNVSSFTASNFTQNGATFAWQVSGLPATNTNSYIYNQKLEVKRNSDGVVVYTQDNISPGTSGATTIVVSDASILPSTQYYATVTVTANDPWKTSNWPNNQIRSTTVFSTTGLSPVNTIAPVISPLNNRSRAPVNTQLSSSTGTWTNVQSGATYQYQWTYDDGNTPYYFPSSSTWTSANTFSGIPTSFAANGSVTVKVKVTNPDGGFGITQSPNSYLLDPAVSYTGSITPSNAQKNISYNFNFPTINNYPTSYVISWGDGTASYVSGAITSGTASVTPPTIAHTYANTGNYSLSIVAQPGNIQSSITVTVTSPPVNTAIPVITPTNNRGYVPYGLTLTSSSGSWSNTVSPTYQYDWYLEDSAGGALQIFTNVGSTRTFTSTNVTDYVFTKVTATNGDGSGSTAAYSNTYTIDNPVSYDAGSIAPLNADVNVSTTYNCPNINNYPTSYTINWGDGTADYSSGSIASNTATVSPSVAHTYSTAGTYTLTVTAQPGSVQKTGTITIAPAIATVSSALALRTDVGYITIFYTASPALQIDTWKTYASRNHPIYGYQQSSITDWISTEPPTRSEDNDIARGWNYIYVGGLTDYANTLYPWNVFIFPVRNTVTGNVYGVSPAYADSNTNMPTVILGSTVNSNGGFSKTVSFGGYANRYTLDIKTGSYFGTSIAGYPQQNLSGNISVTGLTNGTTYYCSVTPYYYYYVDADHTASNPSNSVRFPGPVQSFTALPTSGVTTTTTTTTTAGPTTTTTTAGPTTTTTTTTTSAPGAQFTCTSSDVAIQCCGSTGCSTVSTFGTQCASGSACTTTSNRCYDSNFGCA